MDNPAAIRLGRDANTNDREAFGIAHILEAVRVGGSDVGLSSNIHAAKA